MPYFKQVNKHHKRTLLTGLLLLLITSPSFAVYFTEQSSELGISFTHSDGRNGQFHFTETAGSGLGFFDFDNDNDLDLFIINGNSYQGQHVLYENLGGRFVDVSKKMGIEQNSQGMGLCAADINQDGWVDFLLTNFGTDYLYLNQQGKKFITKPLDSAATANQWSTGCAFGDLDGDHDLDLYVTRYVDYQMNGNQNCLSEQGKGYCNPRAYRGQEDGLYLNDGQGQFSYKTVGSGIHTGTKDRGFAVIISDLDDDHDMDIYVANDGSDNRLYLNDGKVHFSDNGLLSGSALNQNGMPEAGMGIALADVNSDQFQDLIISHFALETNTLYLNRKGLFLDATQQFKMAKASYLDVGWGVELKDFNLDGYEDLVVANGYIDHNIKETQALLDYKQHNQLSINQKGKYFNRISATESFSDNQPLSSRGLATADWNNDGQIDLAVNNVNTSFTFYTNTHQSKNNWIGFRLIGPEKNRSAIGSRLILKRNDQQQSKQLISGTSFMSQSDQRIVFGLGKSASGIELEVRWPDGRKQKLNFTELNRYHDIHDAN